jgi:hypothetical protein
MKLKLGELPKKTTFNPEHEGWTSLKEPGILTAQLIGFPVGIILSVFTFYLAYAMTDFTWFTSFELLPFTVGLILCIIFHELIHALSFPKEEGEEIYLGFWPMAFAFYAFYTGKIKRNRFLICLLAPFILLSIVPILLMSLLDAHHELLIMICIFNAFASYVDVLGALIILQVPKNAYLINNGWKSYWKAESL